MKHYELMYIIPVKMGDDDSSQVQDKVRAQLTAEGAKLTHEESLGKRKLAYPVDHVRHGTYVVAEFNLEPEKLVKISDWFRLSAEVLRAQVVSKKLKSPEKLAREHALQEKLAREHAAEDAEAERTAGGSAAPAEEKAKPARRLEDLGKKIDEILEQELVK